MGRLPTSDQLLSKKTLKNQEQTNEQTFKHYLRTFSQPSHGYQITYTRQRQQAGGNRVGLEQEGA